MLYLLFFLSGFAALGYQMIWMRMWAAGLGHEVPAMIGVLGAFLGGMTVGAWCLDGRISRSAYPGRWYAGLQMTIGAWAILSALLVPAVSHLALAIAGPAPTHWR